MLYKNIIYEKKEPCGILTFNRPKVRNALSFELINESIHAITNAETDPLIKVLIITGIGDKAFVSGADINELQQRNTLTELEGAANKRRDLTQLLETITKPTIAAINGFATGGGLELAMACNIRIASDNAKMGLPEINLGIIPGNGGTQRLPRLISKGYATEMILTGDLIDANEAFRIGLINHVVPFEELVEKALTIGTKIASKSDLAVKLAKDAINNGGNMGLREGLQYEGKLFAILCDTLDKKEGVAAFLEKRTPNFQGR